MSGPEEPAAEVPVPPAPAVATVIEATRSDPVEPALGAEGVEPSAVVSLAPAAGVVMDPQPRTVAPDADMVLIEDSLRRDPQEPAAPEEMAGGYPPEMIREVGESSGAYSFHAAGLLTASPKEGGRILDPVRFSRAETCEAEV
jgi:hypothetical protein